jgi:hypothetical protein
MNLQERVERLLDSHMIPQAGVTEYGYHVRPAPHGGDVIVEWGHGDPFIAGQFLPQGLKRCAEVLQLEGFELVPAADGLSVLVRP